MIVKLAQFFRLRSGVGVVVKGCFESVLPYNPETENRADVCACYPVGPLPCRGLLPPL